MDGSAIDDHRNGSGDGKLRGEERIIDIDSALEKYAVQNPQERIRRLRGERAMRIHPAWRNGVDDDDQGGGGEEARQVSRAERQIGGVHAL